jgi:SH3-like domain-containing protein
MNRQTLRTILFRSAAIGLLICAASARPLLADGPNAAADAKTSGTPAVSAAQPAPFPFYAEVSGDSVRLRSGPSEKHQTMKVMAKGEKLTVTGERDGWLSVHLPADVGVWVADSFIADLGNNNGMVKGKAVNLRMSPNTNYLPVGQVSDKSVKLVTGKDGKAVKENGFTKIAAPDEAMGWVFAGLLKEVAGTPADASAEAHADKAQPSPAASGPEVSGATAKSDPNSTAAQKLADEARAFRELDRLFLEEMAKPSAERKLGELKGLYRQYSDSAESPEIRKIAKSRVDGIEAAEKKITETAAEAEKRIREARERAAKDEAERLKRIEAEKKSALDKPVEAPNYIATGFIADHGRETRMPASHALTDENGKVLYYLRWDTGDLASLFAKKVSVSGTSQEFDGWDKPVIIVKRCDEAAK